MTDFKPMKLAYGTLGWHVEYLQPALRATEDLGGMVFYYGYVEGYKEKTLGTKDRMVEILEQMGIAPQPRQLNEIFEFPDIVKRIKSDLERDIERGHEIVLFNIAGGTKPMCAAGLMVSIFKGIPAQFVNEKTKKVTAIPLLEADYLKGLSRKQEQIARYVLEHGEDDLTQSDIARSMGKTKATINTHVRTLVDKGVLELNGAADGRSKIVRPTKGIELLFD